MNDNDAFNTILAQYSDAELIGHGGQKQVYRFNHPEYGPSVLKLGICKRDSDMVRIRRECKILKNLDSYYYPKNRSFEEIGDRGFSIIEELIEGQPLVDHIHDYTNPVRALRLIKDIATGLQELWDKDIVHRDVKPNNLIITADGNVKIIDLGIVRMLDEETLTNALVGAPVTAIYAAPEQLIYNKKKIDFRTDLFNLGILLGQLLLDGEHPFDPHFVGGDDIPFNIIQGKWSERSFSGPKLSNIKPLLSKLLGKEQASRFRTPESFFATLNQCLERIS